MPTTDRHGHQRIIWSMERDWPALFLLLVLMLGGGTRTGLASDFLLQLLALPLIWRMIRDFPGCMDWPTRLLFLAIPAMFVFQLLPLPSAQGWRFPFTLDAGRTLEAFTIMLIPMAVFHVVLCAEREQQQRLALFVLAGVGLNFVLALMQFAAPVFQHWLQPFSWEMKAGAFANENHLAALFFASVPLVVAFFRRTAWPWLSVLVITLLILFQFVVGSRAGMGIIILAALFSYALVYLDSWRAFWALVVLAGLAGGLAFLKLPLEGLQQEFALNVPGLSRGQFFVNTLKAALDHLPTGSGLGTFTLVYPKYESLQHIQQVYVNHAHNDWLELLLEGGLPAVFLLLWGLMLVLRALWRGGLSPLQRAAFLALLTLMLHSTLDYPLRTLALASLLALLLAILLSPPERKRRVAFRTQAFMTLDRSAA